MCVCVCVCVRTRDNFEKKIGQHLANYVEEFSAFLKLEMDNKHVFESPYSCSLSQTSDNRDGVATGTDDVGGRECVVAEHLSRDPFQLQLENYLTAPLRTSTPKYSSTFATLLYVW